MSKFNTGDRVYTSLNRVVGNGVEYLKGTVCYVDCHLSSEPEEWYNSYVVLFDKTNERISSLKDWHLDLLIEPNDIIKEIL